MLWPGPGVGLRASVLLSANVVLHCWPGSWPGRSGIAEVAGRSFDAKPALDQAARRWQGSPRTVTFAGIAVVAGAKSVRSSHLRLGRQRLKFRRISLVHLRLQPVARQRVYVHFAQGRRLVGVIDLVAAKAAADPGHRHALRIARRPVFESQIARRRRPGIEMLM